MPYYKITNKKIIAEIDNLEKEYNKQHKSIRAVIKKLKPIGVDALYVTDDLGAYAISLKDMESARALDNNIWINYSKKKPCMYKPWNRSIGQ